LIVQVQPILVRDGYTDLWDHVQGNMAQKMSQQLGTNVYGHPGIGKSASLIYLMMRAAHLKIPLFHYDADETTAFLCVDVGSWTISATDLQDIGFTEPALLLVNAGPQIPLKRHVWNHVPAYLVFASSPASVRYRDIAKERKCSFFTL
jgi:hypothetical protein